MDSNQFHRRVLAVVGLLAVVLVVVFHTVRRIFLYLLHHIHMSSLLLPVVLVLAELLPLLAAVP